jgi:hypothetical protein
MLGPTGSGDNWHIFSVTADTRWEVSVMSASEAQALRARLARLEARVVLITAGWILTIAALVLFGPLTPRAATQPQVIRTPALEIVDARGQVRATLDSVNRKPSLWLYGDDGRRRAGLIVGTGSVPELVLADAEGRPRITLGAGLERAAEIRITDSRGRPRIGLWIGYDDEPGIWLFDELARPRIGMKVLTGGIPRLWMFKESTGQLSFTAP